jgi:hypothetical protein
LLICFKSSTASAAPPEDGRLTTETERVRHNKVFVKVKVF